MSRNLLLICFFLSLSTRHGVFAGKYNRTLDIGDPAPIWKNLPGIDGKQHSLDDLKKKEVVVVVFTCNSCLYAVDYEDRIVAFARQCTEKSKTALVAINVNKVEEDLLPAMKKRAEEKKFTFPYLFDESQQIAKDFGATWTPEFFVLNKERKVIYMGKMDDKVDIEKVTQNYVQDAVDAAVAGKDPEVSETQPIGCLIRYERNLRRRRDKER